MKRKWLVATVLGFGFLGTTYIAVSQTSSGLLAPFMKKTSVCITVGQKMKCNSITERPMTLQDVEKCIRQINFPLAEPQAGGEQQALATSEASDNPVLSFAQRFSCPDDLAEGAMAQNAKEKLWDSDGLFHVIERSKKCTINKMNQLRGKYCRCPRR